MSKDSIFIEYWTLIMLIIAFQTKNSPENTFILFITVSFGEDKKIEENILAKMPL